MDSTVKHAFSTKELSPKKKDNSAHIFFACLQTSVNKTSLKKFFIGLLVKAIPLLRKVKKFFKNCQGDIISGSAFSEVQGVEDALP
jgi:hypothetical protein